MKENIEILHKGIKYSILNSWDAMTPQTFLNYVRYLRKVETGEMPVGVLRIRVLCDLMGWKLRKFTDEEAMANLVVLSEQLTFLFRIQYPDDNAALEGLTDEEYGKAVRVEPEHLDIPQRETLMQLDYRYLPDLCFFRQMLPSIKIGDMVFYGYKASCHNGALSTSLTALRYIEASQALEQNDDARLAAILYAPDPYDSNQAHALTEDVAQADPSILQAVKVNFMALQNFLYRKTPFALLTKFEKSGKVRAITTTMADKLYDLSKDGLGNVTEVERMNVLTYLRILRKQTIDSVRQLHGMKMDIAKIAEEVGLPIEIITKII